MPTKVKAVYEGGVFRPLEPLEFTEKMLVRTFHRAFAPAERCGRDPWSYSH